MWSRRGLRLHTGSLALAAPLRLCHAVGDPVEISSPREAWVSDLEALVTPAVASALAALAAPGEAAAGEGAEAEAAKAAEEGGWPQERSAV